jgi:hypothetical protein
MVTLKATLLQRRRGLLAKSDTRGTSHAAEFAAVLLQISDMR